MIDHQTQLARPTISDSGIEGNTVIVCPICGDASHDALRRIFKVKGYWILTCKCSIHQCTEILPSKHHVQNVYSDSYFKGRDDGYPDYLAEEKILTNRGHYYARIVSEYMSPGTLLDVGAGAGFIQKGFVDNCWKALGIEPNEKMAKHAREKYGLSVITGALEDFETNDQFDLILLIQVIAHFYDLTRAIQRSAKLTKQGGYLLIETWNKNSLTTRIFGRKWHEYNPPSVVNCFTPESLDLLLLRHGYQKITMSRPSRWISGAHAKHVLKSKFSKSRLGCIIARVLDLIPDRIVLPYPAEDLFWSLYKKL